MVVVFHLSALEGSTCRVSFGAEGEGKVICMPKAGALHPKIAYL